MNKADSLKLAIFVLKVFGVMCILFSIVGLVVYFNNIPSSEITTSFFIVISLMGVLAVLVKYDKLANAPIYERSRKLVDALEESERRLKER